MADGSEYLWAIVAIGVVLFLVYLYIGSIERVLESIGFSHRDASAILFGTLFLGWISIPLIPYNGWWIGISIGGALIPLSICVSLILKHRVTLAETFIGITIVSFITYNITRAEEGVGIVAEVPLAFAPAIAAGLYALSVFWMDSRKAAPLAYVSGVVGTLVGADVFHLGEVLAFEPSSDGFSILSIGGANIFDMVYLTGIIAVVIALMLTWAYHNQRLRGYHYLSDDLPVGYGSAIDPRSSSTRQTAPQKRIKGQ